MRAPFKGSIIFLSPSAFVFSLCRSGQKWASVPVLLGARRLQAAANSLATPAPRSPAKKKFSNCAQEGYCLCKQWSPCVASAHAYSSRSPHPDQRDWPGHRAHWPRRRLRRTRELQIMTARGGRMYTRTVEQTSLHFGACTSPGEGNVRRTGSGDGRYMPPKARERCSRICDHSHHHR